jgi:hypothetical protein
MQFREDRVVGGGYRREGLWIEGMAKAAKERDDRSKFPVVTLLGGLQSSLLATGKLRRLVGNMSCGSAVRYSGSKTEINRGGSLPEQPGSTVRGIPTHRPDAIGSGQPATGGA